MDSLISQRVERRRKTEKTEGEPNRKIQARKEANLEQNVAQLSDELRPLASGGGDRLTLRRIDR